MTETAPTEAPPLPRAPSPADRAAPVIAALVITAAFLMALQPVRSADVWHHVKSGWLVTQLGHPAHSDVFSCTAKGRPWVQYEWLAQLLLYQTYQSAATTGLILVRAAGLALVAALLLLACRRRGIGWVASALAVSLALCAISGRAYSRPELFTWIILAAWLLCVENLRQGRRAIVLLPALLMIPWVNMHGAWIAGLAWLGLTATGDTLTYLFGPKDSKALSRLVFLWAALGLAVLATLVNPYGPGIWRVPFKLAESPEVTKRIAEWQRPGLAHWLDPRHIGAWVLPLAVLLAPRRLKAADWLVFLFFGVLSLTARRHVAVTLLVLAPILAGQFAALSDLSSKRWPRLSRLRLPATRIAVSAVACAALVLVALGGPSLTRAGLGLAKEKYPLGAADFIQSSQLHGNLFNTYDFGNYLLFALYPRNLVFIDGRVDMYGSRPVNLYDSVIRASSGWQATLENYDVDLCLLRTNQKQNPRLLKAVHQSPDWNLVYWDDIAAVYLKSSQRRSDFLARAYVYAVPPDTPDWRMLQSPAGLQRAENDYLHRLDQDPRCNRALQGIESVADAYRDSGDIPRAIALLRKAVALRPDHPGATYTLAACLLRIGALDEAQALFQRTIALGDYVGKSHLALGFIHHSRQQPRQALHHLNRALRHDPRNWKTHWNISQIHEQQGDVRKALAAARETALLNPPPHVNASQRIARLERLLKQQGNRP